VLQAAALQPWQLKTQRKIQNCKDIILAVAVHNVNAAHLLHSVSMQAAGWQDENKHSTLQGTPDQAVAGMATAPTTVVPTAAVHPALDLLTATGAAPTQRHVTHSETYTVIRCNSAKSTEVSAAQEVHSYQNVV
jgi:hypothetical protein